MNLRLTAVKLHRWSGLLLALFLINAGLTGSLLAFRAEIDTWLNADAIEVASDAAPLSVESLAAEIRRQRPEAKLKRLFAGEGPGVAWVFQLQQGSETSEVWVDPASGRITGERVSGQLGLDRRHLMPTIMHWHDSLYLEKVGKTIIGSVALLWFLSSLVGIWLAVPRLGALAKAFVIKRGMSSFKTVYDTHRVVGLVTCVVLLGSSFSAVYLGLPDLFRGAVGVVAPTSEPLLARLPKRAPAPAALTMDRALEVARKALPGAVFRGMSAHPDKGVYQVRMRVPGDINSGNGTGRVLVDMQSGAVLEARSYRDAGGAGNTVVAWMYPLHSGQAFGTAGRAVIAGIGIFPGVLALTGVWLWWRRRTMAARRPQAAAARPASKIS